MNVLISNVSFVVGIRPISVHEFYSLVNSERVERIIVAEYKLLYFLLHKNPVDFKAWAQTFVLIFSEENEMES